MTERDKTQEADPHRLAETGVLDEVLAWVDEMTKKHGDPLGTQYEQGVNDHGFRIRGKIAAMLAAKAQPSITKGGDL